MELRVWVDGTQRVVCGVKVTTTCQEIVFALAHATKQAGRFTMIERWRNNERLLSPNEQPLVTLQRWGDHMNEVEFILRKASTDPQQANSTTSNHHTNHDAELNQSQQNKQQTATTNGLRESPLNPMITSNNPHMLQDRRSFDSMSQLHQQNYNRKPQTVLGNLTGSNGKIEHNPNIIQQQQMLHSLTRLPNSFKTTMSTSNLPSATNSIRGSPQSNNPLIRPLFPEDRLFNAGSSNMMTTQNPRNGYQIYGDNQLHPSMTNQPQIIKNYHLEDLYGTVNKTRSHQQPPAVPAKPRVPNSIAPMNNYPIPHQQTQSVNSAHMNYYQNSSPLNMYQSNIRPRHPPGYLDYLEAMSNRNSLPQPITSSSTFNHQLNYHPKGNIYQHGINQPQANPFQQNGSSPIDFTQTNNRYLNLTNQDRSLEHSSNSGQQSMSLMNSKLAESGIVVNRGSAINVKLPQSGSQGIMSHHSSISDFTKDTNLNLDITSSMSQIGQDMLKIIEEQKKVLINQKNELDRLDSDQQYRESRQSSEQIELVNKIENEIRQLEDLWKDNQTQIRKLENQDFERELRELKSEQTKLESELCKQKDKLLRFDDDIAACNSKIEQLEAELASHEPVSDDSSSSPVSSVSDDSPIGKRNDISQMKDSSLNSVETNESPLHLEMHSNGTLDQGHTTNNKEAKSSDDEDEDEDDSGGDASDDLNTRAADSKLRSAKDVAYVDKRGLINGIRSLKLDKSRTLNRQPDCIRSVENITGVNSVTPNSFCPKDNSLITNNNSVENRCLELNGSHNDNTANSKYQFLMTL